MGHGIILNMVSGVEVWEFHSWNWLGTLSLCQ